LLLLLVEVAPAAAFPLLPQPALAGEMEAESAGAALRLGVLGLERPLLAGCSSRAAAAVAGEAGAEVFSPASDCCFRICVLYI
jgi:hypothetical protein